MAVRNVAVPWLGGGLVVLGYAAFSWLRAKRAVRERTAPDALPPHDALEPLSSHVEHIPEKQALDLKAEQLPANSNAVPRSAGLGAFFLGRASEALSPFHFGPDWPSVPR